MNGLILMFLILGIGAALGTQTAYCLNPAVSGGSVRHRPKPSY